MTSLLALAILQNAGAQPQGGGQAPPSEVTPSQLVTAMVAKYAGAKTLSGTVVAEIQAANSKVRVRSEITYVRPNRLLIRQTEEFQGQRQFLVVCDGVRLVYTNPLDHLRQREPYLVEDAVKPIPRAQENNFQGGLRSMNLGEIYAAGTQSIADRNVPLDLAVGRREDLVYLQGQLAEINDGGTVVYNGQAARKIHGPWKPFPDAAHPQALYEMYITEAGDLVGYRLIETFRINKRDVQMISSWNVNFRVNVPVEGSLFRLPKGVPPPKPEPGAASPDGV